MLAIQQVRGISLILRQTRIRNGRRERHIGPRTVCRRRVLDVSDIPVRDGRKPVTEVIGTRRQRVIAECRCVENRLFDSVYDGSSSTAFSSACTEGRATVPHAIYDMVAGRIGRVHRPVPSVAVQVPALRVLRIGPDQRRIRTHKPFHSRSIIPRREKVHPSLAISDLPRELLLDAVARPKQQTRGAPRIPSRNLLPKTANNPAAPPHCHSHPSASAHCPDDQSSHNRSCKMASPPLHTPPPGSQRGHTHR